jgi:hypothetical protein
VTSSGTHAAANDHLGRSAEHPAVSGSPQQRIVRGAEVVVRSSA